MISRRSFLALLSLPPLIELAQVKAPFKVPAEAVDNPRVSVNEWTGDDILTSVSVNGDGLFRLFDVQTGAVLLLGHSPGIVTFSDVLLIMKGLAFDISSGCALMTTYNVKTSQSRIISTLKDNHE